MTKTYFTLRNIGVCISDQSNECIRYRLQIIRMNKLKSACANSFLRLKSQSFLNSRIYIGDNPCRFSRRMMSKECSARARNRCSSNRNFSSVFLRSVISLKVATLSMRSLYLYGLPTMEPTKVEPSFLTPVISYGLSYPVSICSRMTPMTHGWRHFYIPADYLG